MPGHWIIDNTELKFMKHSLIIIMLFVSLLQAGCYYDKHDVLNPASATCDTAIVTYSGSISPVLAANCTGCHSGANAPLNIRLDVYSNVNVQALNGSLLGAVTHSAGFSPMPKNGTKLSDCNISKIAKWIEAGAPNN